MGELPTDSRLRPPRAGRAKAGRQADTSWLHLSRKQDRRMPRSERYRRLPPFWPCANIRNPNQRNSYATCPPLPKPVALSQELQTKSSGSNPAGAEGDPRVTPGARRSSEQDVRNPEPHHGQRNVLGLNQNIERRVKRAPLDSSSRPAAQEQSARQRSRLCGMPARIRLVTVISRYFESASSRSGSLRRRFCAQT